MWHFLQPKEIPSKSSSSDDAFAQKEENMANTTSRKKVIKSNDFIYRKGIYTSGYYSKKFAGDFKTTFRQEVKNGGRQ